MQEGKLLPSALVKLGINEGIITILQSCTGWPFVLSLSEMKDDLYMWNSYANHGNGVAIGFDMNILKKEYTKDLRKCEYISVDNLYDRYKTKAKDLANTNNDQLPLARLLYNDCLYYKHSAFAAEHEWRLVIHDVEDEFCLGSKGVTPFKNIKIPTSALKSITFGPKVNFEHNSFAVKKLLKSKIKPEKNCVFLQSEIPLI